MTTIEKKSYWRITGEFVTNHARDLLKEGDWTNAARFLTTSICGFTLEHAQMLLSGDYRLIGESHGPDVQTIALDKDTTEEAEKYKEHLKYMFAGIFKTHHGGDVVYLRPYAICKRWCKDDIDFDGSIWYRKSNRWRTDVLVDDQKDKLLRSLYYADDRYKDYAHWYVPEHAVFILKEVKSPPPWINIHSWIDEAIKEYIDVRGVPPHVNQPYFSEFSIEQRQYEQEKLEEAKKAIIGEKAEETEEDEEVEEELFPAVEDKNFFCGNGWIAPDGKFYGCQYGEHKFLAETLVKQIYKLPFTEVTYSYDYEKILEAAKFLKIFTNAVDNKHVYIQFKPTPSQEKALFGWMTKHNVTEKQITRWPDA